MWREYANWEDFPTVSAAHYSRPRPHPLDEAVNRVAERVLGVVIAGGPFFYVALFLAFLAVRFGIVS